MAELTVAETTADPRCVPEQWAAMETAHLCPQPFGGSVRANATPRRTHGLS